MNHTDHDYIHEIRARQSATPPAPELVGHSAETVMAKTRMKSFYDVQTDQTKYSWQYGNHRYTATYSFHHRGGNDQRLWEQEYSAKARTFLLNAALHEARSC